MHKLVTYFLGAIAVAAVGATSVAVYNQGTKNIENWQQANSNEHTGPKSTFIQAAAVAQPASNTQDPLVDIIEGRVPDAGAVPSFMQPIR